MYIHINIYNSLYVLHTIIHMYNINILYNYPIGWIMITMN